MPTPCIKRIRTVVTTMLMALMLAGGFGAPATAVAQNQTVQSQLTGDTISYGSQYGIQPGGTFEPDTLEMIMFLGPADILAVGFLSPLLDLNSARDIMLESLVGAGFTTQTIDRGDYTGVSYSLDMMNIDGMEMGVFTLFMNQRAHGYSEFYIFMAPPSLFAATMQTAQNSFTIDGNPLMNGVDAGVMGDMVVANQGITGGTSATDVEDVTEQPDTTGTSETNTTETTGQTTVTDDSARAEYLAAVDAEYNMANTEWANFLITFDEFSKEELTVEEAAPIMNSAMDVLAGTNDRAATIQAPAGMEAFHQEYLDWAQAMTDIGVAWLAFIDQTGTSEAHSQAMQNGLAINDTFGASLDAELSSASDDPGATEAAPTEPSSTGPVDRETYLTAVQTEYDNASLEIVTILDILDQMANDEITAQDARPAIDASHAMLAGTNERIGAIQPPVGMEAFHQDFVAWAGSMTEMGTSWADAIATGDTTAYNTLFSTAIDAHVSFGDTLEAEQSGGGTEAGNEEVATEEAAETSRTTRTTRGTTTEATEEAAETSRTPRTSRPGGASDGNTSETGGSRTSTTRTSTTSGTGDSGEYLEAVREEYDHISDQLVIIEDTLAQMSDGTISDEDAIEALTNANVELGDAQTRIEDLEAPAGLEAFHEEFLDWSDEVVAVGDLWLDFVNGDIEAADYIDGLLLLMDDTATFGDLLEDEEAIGRIDITTFSVVARELKVA